MMYKMQDQYSIDNPEPWYIRRGAHKGALLADLAVMYHFRCQIHCSYAFSIAMIFQWDCRKSQSGFGFGYYHSVCVNAFC